MYKVRNVPYIAAKTSSSSIMALNPEAGFTPGDKVHIYRKGQMLAIVKTDTPFEKNGWVKRGRPVPVLGYSSGYARIIFPVREQVQYGEKFFQYMDEQHPGVLFLERIE